MLLHDRFQSFEPLRYAFNLCLDAGFVGKDDVVVNHGFTPHIRGRCEEKQMLKRDPNFRAKRWIVEAINSWLKRFRMLCPCYEKTLQSFRGLLTLAIAMTILNKVMGIYP